MYTCDIQVYPDRTLRCVDGNPRYWSLLRPHVAFTFTTGQVAANWLWTHPDGGYGPLKVIRMAGTGLPICTRAHGFPAPLSQGGCTQQ